MLGVDNTQYDTDIERDTIINDDNCIKSLRLSLKYNPDRVKKWLGIRFGMGTGTSAGGSYLFLDNGFILGFENPFIVPYTSIGLFVSLPLNPHEVYLGKDSDGNEQYSTPILSYGPEIANGLKIFIINSECNRNYKVNLSLQLLISFTFLHTEEINGSVFSFGGGMEIDI